MPHVSRFRLVCALLVLTGCILMNYSAPCAGEAPSPRKEIAVLTIGNSFSQSLYVCLEKAADSAGCKLTLDNLNIGGCSLERHWSNAAHEESEPGWSFFEGYTYKQKISSRKWDFISLQQASHFSWQDKTYQPFLHNLVKFVRANAPDSEIVLQQTWAYRPDDGRLDGWGIDQQKMYQSLVSAYSKAATEEHLRIIPVGLAVQQARSTQSCGYTPFKRSDFKYPEKPDMSCFLCGNLQWSKDHTKLEGDSFHLNLRGQYLQACVWFAFMYNRSASEIKWVPAGITADDALFLRQTADQALEEYKTFNQNVVNFSDAE